MTDKPQNDISNSEEWQAAKAKLDEKDLLMRQTFALEAIEQHLRAMRATEKTENTETQETYTCSGCQQAIPENELKSHAKHCLNWTEAYGDVKQMYNQ